MALYEQTPVASAATLAPTDLLGSPNYVEQTASGSQTIDDSLNHMSTKDHATISNVLSARDSNVADASMADRIEPPSGDKVTDSAPIDTTDVANQQPKGKRISFEDFIDLNDVVFEWADSYDNKDWKRLAKILAPTLIVDYSIVGHERVDGLPAADFIAMMSSEAFLGDPLVKTQHLMGARRFEYVSDTEILGHHQIRAAHQRYCADGETVERRGHGHSYIKHWYAKVDGRWKLSGLGPKIYWNEKDFDKIFVQLKGQR